MCNSQKGHKPWVDWYRAQPFWSALGEWAIVQWITSHSEHRQPDSGEQHAA
jgi:hypothetical protein